VGGRAAVVTNQEIEEVAKKTGLGVDEVLSKLREALIRNSAYVKIAGPQDEVRIELFSPMTSPEEGAVARKWLSDHVADLFAGSDYLDGAVVVGSLENDEALKDAACRS
jgi:uncharacterized protein YbjT (DUF2867 family)